MCLVSGIYTKAAAFWEVDSYMEFAVKWSDVRLRSGSRHERSMSCCQAAAISNLRSLSCVSIEVPDAGARNSALSSVGNDSFSSEESEHIALIHKKA